MPIVITGDMTAEEIDQAMINDLNAILASSSADGNITVSHRQIARVLELLGDKGKVKEIKSQAIPGPGVQQSAAKAALASAKMGRAQLNEMTKEELVEYADDHDIEVAASWPKADIVDAIVKHK